jgi:hypothetical protein
MTVDAWPRGPATRLCDHLDKRFADTTVLTRQQVEDLLGVARPEPAFTDPAWLSNTGTGASGTLCSDAWTWANRTARPDLRARTASFERGVAR